MSRQRLFLSMSCVDAARERMRHVYDTFDTVCVQFSGGKDSTAVLYLAKEIHEERGLGPVKVIFRDEEMVSPLVAEFIEKVRNYEWVDMEWYCLPQGQEIWSMGKRQYVLLWSKKREREGRLIRPIPSWAITAESFGLDPNKQIPQSIDYYTMQGKKGRTAFITGVRANESVLRYRSLVQKLHENYIVTPYRMKRNMPLRFAKVIYDWTTDDVLKFIAEEHGAEYCKYYDLAAITQSNTRVGIPLHPIAIRRIGDLIATEPEFYDKLWETYPMIDVQRRLWPDYDIEQVIMDYASRGWDGVRECVDQNILTPGIHKHAMAYCALFRKKMQENPSSYPLHWLIRNILMYEIVGVTPHPPGPRTKAYAIINEKKNEEEDEQ